MATGRSPTLIISHWDKLLEDLHLSVQAFYSAVEEALRRRRIPNSRFFRIDWREGVPFSARREYLRVVRNGFVFDICGAPFGTGFFVSWWLGELPSGCLSVLSRIQLIGSVVDAFVRPTTFYRIDAALMFQTAVHAAVLEVIDTVSSAQGVRPPSELERKPILRDLFEG